MTLARELRTLAGCRRTTANFEKIGDRLAELDEQAAACADLLTVREHTRETVLELTALLEGQDDNPLTGDTAVLLAAAERFLAALPSEENDPLPDLISDAQDKAQGYEETLDRDYTAADRESAWEELCDALDAIADAIDVPEQES
jgi:hypothetical protein